MYDCNVQTGSVYLHWPFCPYKCHFCPFVALASHDQFMGQYHQALCSEIAQFGAQFAQKPHLNTIFMGGGTPSTYPDELILDMSGILKSVFSFDEKTEFTIEVNPGTVRLEQFEIWKKTGINRLSIGVQSLNDKVLRSLNRLQKAEDVFFLLNHASQFFENISIDLILGLPGVCDDEWKDLVGQAVNWPIKHMSVYFLTVHENTPLYFKVRQKKILMPPDERIVNLYHWTRDMLGAHGFDQYELSNFAKRGYTSKHNTVYWDREPYKGFGLGACSFDGALRFGNDKNLMSYMEKATHKKDTSIFCEKLEPKQIHLEKVMLGLRRAKGVRYQSLVEDLNLNDKKKFDMRIEVLQNKKFIYEKDGNIALTPEGLVVENEIITQLTF